jgi:hemoglobin/transferrin/lactoferrin receptor protein
LRHRLELYLSAADGKRDVDESRGPLFHTPGYGVFDAYWRWVPNDRVTLDVGARNLTDRRYWLWAGVRGLAPNAREVDLYTQPGRSLAVTLAVGW